MTICIVAICTMDVDSADTFRCSPGQEVIIGISDRMVSSDYAQGEIPLPKYDNLVNSIVLLSSGSHSIHNDILEKSKKPILKDFNDDPRAIPVIDVAEIYSQNFIKNYQMRLDNRIRASTGLDYRSYLDQINNFTEEKREEVKNNIDRLQKITTIITGIDDAGAHVYHILHDGSIRDENRFGLSTIGSGSLMADIGIVQKIQIRKSPFSETLIDMFMAKKRAEIDPFVGEYTDILIISNDHSVNVLSENSIKLLDKLYEEIMAKHEEAKKEAANVITDFLSKDDKMQLI